MGGTAAVMARHAAPERRGELIGLECRRGKVPLYSRTFLAVVRVGSGPEEGRCKGHGKSSWRAQVSSRGKIEGRKAISVVSRSARKIENRSEGESKKTVKPAKKWSQANFVSENSHLSV